jgi:hypothetical protein
LKFLSSPRFYQHFPLSHVVNYFQATACSINA